MAHAVRCLALENHLKTHLQRVFMIQQSAGSDLITLLLQELENFTGSRTEPEDDVTLVSLERKEPE